MQSYATFLLLSICYLSTYTQSENATTMHVVVETTMVAKTTTIGQTTAAPTTTTTERPTTPHVTAELTTTVKMTLPPIMSTTTAAANVSNKALAPPYVEPPPHPLGYCIRSRLRCSKIRRCCKGPCDVNSMKCPS